MTKQVTHETTFKCDLCGDKTVPYVGSRELFDPPEDWRRMATHIQFYHACPKHTFEEWGDFIEALGQPRPTLDYMAKF